MIFRDLVIGTDRYGRSLKCGDICKYTITHENNITNEYRGMIVYESSDYTFAFEQLTDDFPLVLMNVVNMDTIELLYSFNRETVGNIPDSDKWREIYNSNCGCI